MQKRFLLFTRSRICKENGLSAPANHGAMKRKQIIIPEKWRVNASDRMTRFEVNVLPMAHKNALRMKIFRVLASVSIGESEEKKEIMVNFG